MNVTGWDDIMGFNAHSHIPRLPIVAKLARWDIEQRGIGVKNLVLYASERGIYCSFALDIPEPVQNARNGSGKST